MRPQSFRVRQRLDERRNLLQPGPRKPLNADQLYEIKDTKPTPEACSTSRGQDVIGTGSVVASGLW